MAIEVFTAPEDRCRSYVELRSAGLAFSMRAADLVKLAKLRRGPRRDPALAPTLAIEFKAIQAKYRQLGKAGVAWNAAAPAALKKACELISFSRGTLTVRASDHSIRFEVDRWLRSGGKEALAAHGAKLRSVKVLCF